MLPPAATHAAMNLTAGDVYPLGDRGVLTVETDVRVEVAVAGVEHVADDETVAVPDLGDTVHDVGERGPWDHGVLDHQVRRDPAHGAEGALAALPEPRTVGGAAARTDGARAVPSPVGARSTSRFGGHGLQVTVQLRSEARLRRRSDSRRREMDASTAATHARSIISSAAGTIPAAMMAETASLAPRSEGKSASNVRTLAGSGSSRTVIRVAMPNMPSLPTNSPARSGPHGSPCAEPSRTTDASGNTTSSSTT